MPLFYFDIQDGRELPDQHGLQLADLGVAQAYALEMAATFLRKQDALFWQDHEWSIAIRDVSGTPLYRLQFQLTRPITGDGKPDGSMF